MLQNFNPACNYIKSNSNIPAFLKFQKKKHVVFAPDG